MKFTKIFPPLFSAYINSDEVKFHGESYDLIIDYGNGDSIRIQNFFYDRRNWVHEFHFADCAVVKQNEIQGLINAQNDRSLARTMSYMEESTVPTVDQ